MGKVTFIIDSIVFTGVVGFMQDNQNCVLPF